MLAVVGWVGVILQFIASHFNAALGAACGIAALIASVYSIKASRAKARFYEKETDSIPQQR